MKTSAAEILALDALAYLASHSNGLPRFIALSGLAPEDLRNRAGDSELLASVIDFLLSDEVLCAGFLEAKKLDPRTLHAARRALPGAA